MYFLQGEHLCIMSTPLGIHCPSCGFRKPAPTEIQPEQPLPSHSFPPLWPEAQSGWKLVKSTHVQQAAGWEWPCWAPAPVAVCLDNLCFYKQISDARKSFLSWISTPGCCIVFISYASLLPCHNIILPLQHPSQQAG